jgi:hypothetical protein
MAKPNYQVHGTDKIQSDSKGQKIFSSFLKVLGSLIFILFGFIYFSSFKLSGLYYFIISVIYFVFIHKIVWSISNKIRMWVLPEAFVATSATDGFRQKIFWNIGPQFSGWFMILAFLLWIPNIWSPNMFDGNSNKSNQTVQENSELSNKGSNSVPKNYQGKWSNSELNITCDNDPLIIDEKELKQGGVFSNLNNMGDSLASDHGDKFVFNSNNTLTIIFKQNPESKIVFTRCN